MSDFVNLQNSLDQKRQELARLEGELERSLNERLAKLPEETGFASMDALILRLAHLASRELRDVVSRTATKGTAPPEKTRRPRSKITAQKRSQLVEAISTGKKTAAEVAVQFSVSQSTVNQLKRAQGLTKRRRS